MRVAIKTLGCKSNRYESDKVLEALKGKFEVVEVNEGAKSFMGKNSGFESDLLIVNTCTVTHVADRKSRQAVRSFKRRNPECKVVVFGCASNLAKKEYESMSEVDFRADDAEAVMNFAQDLAKQIEETEKCFYEGNKLDVGIRTRALLKIQDGCNSYCSYCIIPFTRGPELSFGSDRILQEAQKQEAEGYEEIVLTGINIGEWKENGMDLADLFEKLIIGTESVRFRVSSIEPKNFSAKFFDLFKTGRFCPHMHMSLQSGCDSVLKRMRRNYDTGLFYKVCEKLRNAVPDMAITTDIIVGFPGETELEFVETMEFARKLAFTKIHVFPYSRRKNTAAYHMKGQVSDDEKKDRCQRLRELSDEMEMEFRKTGFGKEYSVVVENMPGKFCGGITENYIPVKWRGNEKIGEVVTVKLKRFGERGVVESVVV